MPTAAIRRSLFPLAVIASALLFAGPASSLAIKHKFVGDPIAEDDLAHHWAQTTPCNRTQKCIYTKPQNLFCADVCVPGSVQVSDWLYNAMKTQIEIQLDTPLNYVNFAGSHNSAIARSYGFGIEEQGIQQLVQPYFGNSSRVYIANQEFSLTDQMNMGLRQIELDTHWWKNKLRICHAGGVHMQWLTNFVQEIFKVLHIDAHWDSETLGCWGDNLPLLNDSFLEIQTWLNQPQNSDQFLIFMFDDQEDLETWHKVGLMVEGIQAYFGRSAFTVLDFKNNGGKWPTLRELRTMGKQVMFVSATNYGQDMYPWIFNRDDVWIEVSVREAEQGFPGCKFANHSSYTGQIIRGIGDSLMMGPIENGPKSEGFFMPHSWRKFSDCAVNFICGDQISPTLLEQGAVWTWAVGQPQYVSRSGSDGCTFVSIADGRWSSLDPTSCESASIQYPISCVKVDDRLSWAVSAQITTGAAANTDLCPQFYTFAVPTNARENMLLLEALQTSYGSNKTVTAAWIPWRPIVF